jgi:hypothetical protein
MANYYYINIESEKMTQNVANEIFQTIAPKQQVRWFEFKEGRLNYNTRGLEEISEILAAYGFNDDEDKIEIKDEFNYAYDNMMTPEEAMGKKIEDIINEIQMLEEHGIELSEEMINIKKVLNNTIKEK